MTARRAVIGRTPRERCQSRGERVESPTSQPLVEYYPKVLIVVAGNVGSGKSTFCRALSSATGLELAEEPWRDNPHLELAYEDPSRHRARAAEWFVEAGIAQHRRLLEHGGIHDCGVDGHVRVFAEHYRRLGLVDDATHGRILRAYDEHLAADAPPDLLVYLETTPSLVLERVAERGRAMEATAVDAELILSLHRRWEALVDGWSRSRVVRIPPYPIERLDSIIADVVGGLPE